MSFATAINCMDGRVQGAVRKCLKSQYGVKWVDKITDAGPAKMLAEKKDLHGIERITRLLRISIVEHGSRVVAIAAHEHCAANQTTKKRQVRQLRAAKKVVTKIVQSFGLNFEVEIILLWVDKTWMPREIFSLKPYMVIA